MTSRKQRMHVEQTLIAAHTVGGQSFAVTVYDRFNDADAAYAFEWLAGYDYRTWQNELVNELIGHSCRA